MTEQDQRYPADDAERDDIEDAQDESDDVEGHGPLTRPGAERE